MAYTIQLLDITEVSLNDNNPRFIKDKSFKDLVKSLKECPALFDARPLLCNGDRVILGGNMRYRAALELRYTEVPVIIMEGLTPEQEREIVIKDNGGFGSWDFEALANDWSDLPLDEWGVDLPEGWLQEPEEAPEEEEFNAEPPKEPITVLGDLYELNGHRLHCADSTDSDAVAKLMDGKKADMVFTDPPYGVSYTGGHNKKKRKGIENDELAGEQLTDLFYGSLVNGYTFTHDHAAFYIWYSTNKTVETFASFSNLALNVRAVLCWYKIKSGLGAFMAQYIPNFEPCIYAHKTGCSPQWFGPSDEKSVWELKKENVNEYHPTQKPVELPERAINNSSKKGDIILDFFLGSHSTLIAAEITKRICYGQELDPAYCDVGVRRWVKYMQDNNRPYTVKRNGQELSKAEIDQFFTE